MKIFRIFRSGEFRDNFTLEVKLFLASFIFIYKSTRKEQNLIENIVISIFPMKISNQFHFFKTESTASTTRFAQIVPVMSAFQVHTAATIRRILTRNYRSRTRRTIARHFPTDKDRQCTHNSFKSASDSARERLQSCVKGELRCV